LQQRAAYVTVGLAMHQMMLGQYAEARATARHGLQLSYAAQDRMLICWGMDILGMIALAEGRYDTAEQLLRQTLILAREVGRPEEQSSVLASLGYLALKKGSAGQAQLHIRGGLQVVRDSHNIVAALLVLPTVALYLKLQGEVEQAHQLVSLCKSFGFFRRSAFFAALYGPHFGEGDTPRRETPETGTPTDALWHAADSLICKI